MSRFDIKEQLWPTYLELNSTGIMDVRFYAYGNTNKIKSKEGLWEFTSQHLKKECQLNLVVTCSNYLYDKPDVGMSFIHCVAKYQTMEEAKKCAKEQKYEMGEI